MTVRSGGDALYHAIADELRERILSGDLKPGDQVPTEKALADHHRVSRNTVRQALNALTNEGHITPGRGKAGRFVRDIRPFTWGHSAYEGGSAGADEFMTAASKDPTRKATEDISVLVVSAVGWLAPLLGVGEGDTVVMRRRVRKLGGELSQLSESFYPYELVRDTAVMHPADIEHGATKLLAEMGYQQVRYLDRISTRMPRPDEVADLDIGPGIPVLRHIRVGYTDKDEPVRVTRTIMPGDRHILSYEIPA